MKYSKPFFLLGVMVLAFVLVPQAFASPVTVSISPTNPAVPQGSTATYTVALSGAKGTSYSLSLSGLSGASGSFSPNPLSTPPGMGTGSGSTTLTIDTTSTGLYCPGTYSFTVSAVNATALTPPMPGPSDTGSAGASLTVIQVGPPLAITVSTDKSSYRIGDTVTVAVTANRPAEGYLTISTPSGSPATFSYIFYGPSYAITKTLTANTIGHWNLNFQADDFCSGFSSASAAFDVTPNTYDVSLSLNGVPTQYSSQLKVDGQSQGTIRGSEIKGLTFGLATTHTIAVDQYVQGDTGVRYYASQTTWTVSSAGSHTFSYQTQYLFSVVTDPDGVTPVSGGGWYTAGTSVQTNQVPTTVPGPTGTQYAFQGWVVDGAAQSSNGISLNMDKPHTAIAKYQTQYQLLIDSPYGAANGQGYYAAGSTATFSVSTPWGFPVQQVFVRWEGDYTGTNPQGSVTMDKPKVVHAVWSTSYIPLIALIVVALAVVAGILFWKKRKRPPPETKPTPSAAAGEEAAKSVKCASCGTDNSTDQKFCTNCGEKLTESKKHHT
ncbi:MAG: zinc ribbon domain-containing protein [Candidatus Bathyarchaeia archaeon]